MAFRTHPVLIQGETSVGKTSLIRWLAAATGNHCVRINNHEHTDIQEYIGCYTSDASGKLVFKEGKWACSIYSKFLSHFSGWGFFFLLLWLTCLVYCNGKMTCHKVSSCTLMMLTCANFSEFWKVHVCLIMLVLLDLTMISQQFKQYCCFLSGLLITVYSEWNGLLKVSECMLLLDWLYKIFN